MILAVDQMEPVVQGIFYLAAVIVFVIAAFAHTSWERVNLVALGLAVFAVPFAWNALAAA